MKYCRVTDGSCITHGFLSPMESQVFLVPPVGLRASLRHSIIFQSHAFRKFGVVLA